MDHHLVETDPAIKRCVAALKAAYVYQRRGWRPNVRPLGNTLDHKFAAAARILLKHNIDPDTFVAYVFDQLAEKCGGDLNTNQVLSENMINKYVAGAEERTKRTRLMVDIQMHTLRVQHGLGFTFQEIAADPNLDLSPAFRYAIAKGYNFPRLAAEFEADAMRIFSYDPLYRELLAALMGGRV